MAYTFDQSILRAYDIRGEFGLTLSEKDGYYIGRSFATYMQENKIPMVVAVGRDGRLSSPAIHKEMIRGLVECGAKVLDIGIVPTPELYYACFNLECNAGIMITGSHNPPAHNGFKMVMNKYSFFGDKIQRLGEIAKSGEFAEGKGSVENVNLHDKYVEDLINRAFGKCAKELRVAWDPGNGATGEVVASLAKKLPGKHFVINEKIDGNFPAHHPDPTVPENMDQLRELVKREKCDFGLAFDGDGDRLGAVDANGRMIFGDQLLLIYARDLLKRTPGAKVIADVKTSDAIFNAIRQFGGEPIMWKTGHSLIKAKMKEEGAPLAGEMSGHLFFGENYYGFDDSLFGATKLIHVMANEKMSITELVDTFPKTYSTPEIRVEVKEEEKFNIVDNIKDIMNANNVKFNELDGVRIVMENGWWLVRASNTQNILVVRVEGNDLTHLKTNIDSTLGYFTKLGITAPELRDFRKTLGN